MDFDTAPYFIDDGVEFDYSTPTLDAFLSSAAGRRSGSPADQGLSGTAQELPLLQLSEWDARSEDDELNPTCIHYSIEWKLQLRKGRLSTLTEITEENLTLAPGAYWDKFLQQALATRVQAKLRGSNYEPDETKITVSVEKRSERDLRKRFDEVDIDWKTVEDKLRAWGPLFREGKKIRIDICFIYKESGQAAAMKTRSSNKKGASSKQLAARDELLAQQEEASGRRPVWKEVYELLRCNGPFCDNKQFYCWRDPDTKMHYKLESTVLAKLVDFAEEGNSFQTHNDVPEHIRDLLYKQRELNSERKGRKRKATDELPALNIRLCCRGHDEAESCGSDLKIQDLPGRYLADVVIPEPRDKALLNYYQWHCGRVESPTWKHGFLQVYQIAKEECLDLKHVHETRDVSFFTTKGVKLGIAKSFVGDVLLWAEHV